MVPPDLNKKHIDSRKNWWTLAFGFYRRLVVLKLQLRIAMADLTDALAFAALFISGRCSDNKALEGKGMGCWVAFESR